MSSNLFSYYTSLFSIEIAVFGIISAVILVFIQLVYSSFSYRHIGHILKNNYLRLFFIFSALDLLLTAIGSFFLSFGYHNFIPNYYLFSDAIISSPYYVLLCLVLIFISILFFVILIAKNIIYLQPSRALFLLTKRITYSDIRDYLWSKFGVDVPFNIRFVFESEEHKKEESEEEYKERLRKESEEEEAKSAKIHEEAEEIKKQVENKEDPLLPLLDMALQFIRKSDLRSLEEVKRFVCNISEDFFKNIPESPNKEWVPEHNLGINYIKHLTSMLNTLLELGEKEQLESTQRSVLEVSHCIALKLLELERYGELDDICEFWQEYADKNIGKSSSIFQLIISYYEEIGEELLDKLKDKASLLDDQREDELENVFRYVSWLGERLLLKVPIEESPLIRVFDYNTEYDALYNCLGSFSYKYNHEQAHRYPLIYFDALYVILVKLIPIFKARRDSDIGNNIFSICHDISSFAENAISAKNSAGVALAAMRIKEAYKELKKAGLDEQAKDCMELLVRVGMLAAAHKDDLSLSGVHFMQKPIDEYAIDEIVQSGENVANEVKESYIKLMGGNHDKRWGFITRLGMRLGTNFGFMFDPTTGELYPDNDLRRK